MLTKGDDFPLHQTAEPIAFAGTDRNYYDRYFFNAYTPDLKNFAAVAFGVYPHLNIADAHFSFAQGHRQVCIHGSRYLNMERLDLAVGPIRIEVLEPLVSLRVTVAEHEGVAAELTFTGRHFPLQEPRFTFRVGPRTLMDYTRLTQNCEVRGWVSVDGVRTAIGEGSRGTRDRSWGIRPIGAADAQPPVPPRPPGFAWQWTPMNFPERSLYFHINAKPDGVPFNLAAVMAPDGAGPEAFAHFERPALTTRLKSGTRWPEGATLNLPAGDGTAWTVALTPRLRFQMRGIGYVSPKWNHGAHHGPLVVEREDIDLAQLDPLATENLHVQYVSEAVLSIPGQPDATGVATFEQLILGPYTPMGFTGYGDSAP